MRPNNENTYTTTGTATERVQMGFDPAGALHLMNVLTELYSDEALAAIREYSTNARDSHIAAGVADQPILISRPTRFRPTFSVKDTGLGLSIDDIYNVYSKYGASTKRESDDETGTLGLGSKSGLAYADQFSVRAIKDGVRVLATVARDDEGAGVINILDTSATDEPNGVTISIPVDNVHEFNQKITRFFRWWDEGTVLIDGKPHERVSDEHAMPVEDDLTIYKNGALDNDYVLMGGVAYPADRKLSQNLPYGNYVVATVPMGAVNFVPSREALQYTKLTERTLGELRTRLMAGIKQAAESDIKNAATHTAAVKAAMAWKAMLGGTKVQYKGKDIPSILGSKDRWSTTGPTWFVYNPNSYRYAVNTSNRIDIESAVRALYVTGYTNQSVSPPNRKKIKEWMKQKDISYGYQGDISNIVFCENLPDATWLDDVITVDWDEVKAIRLPRTSAGGGPARNLEQFQVYYKDSKGQPVTETVDTDKIPGDDLIMLSNAQQLGPWDILKVFPKATVINDLNRNRWDKFVREHDNARSSVDALKELGEAVQAAWSDFDYLAIENGTYGLAYLDKLDSSKINDPELVALIDAYHDFKKSNREAEWQLIRNTYRRATAGIDGRRADQGLHLSVKDRKVTNNPMDVVDRYPLLGYAGNISNRQHVYDYINSFYEKAQESK